MAAQWDSQFGQHGEHFAGTESMETFRSKVLGMNRAPDRLQRNQPLKQRPAQMSRRARAGNRVRRQTY